MDPEKQLKIERDLRDGVTCSLIAAEHGVSFQAVFDIQQQVQKLSPEKFVTDLLAANIQEISEARSMCLLPLQNQKWVEKQSAASLEKFYATLTKEYSGALGNYVRATGLGEADLSDAADAPAEEESPRTPRAPMLEGAANPYDA